MLAPQLLAELKAAGEKMESEESNRAYAGRIKATMEADFNPGYTPENTPDVDLRIAIALEYIAYQLGQINRKLDKISAKTEWPKEQ